ncbi:hypothetical protein ACFL6S_28820 [Candidatus Poribacteria bacterium]
MNTFLQFLILLAAPVVLTAGVEQAPHVSLHPVTLDWLKLGAMVEVRGTDDTPRSITPQIRADGADVVSVQPLTASVSVQESALFFVSLEATPPAQNAKMTFALKEFPEIAVSCDISPGIDLSRLSWEIWHQGEDFHADDTKNIPSEAATWTPTNLPKLWNELGITWARTRFVIPESLHEVKLWLNIGAIDDHDVTFLNGNSIGRTNGWDVPRSYELPADLINWGKENEICIAVDNVNAGGGIYQTPIAVDARENLFHRPMFAGGKTQKEMERKPPGSIGQRLPLRRMVVRDGVVYYEDGGEVALWGVNYYPQSWWHYNSLKKLGIDHRQSIDEDFEDFVQMGFDIIRIHVFDTEISDGSGNLVHNDHLDVLDYLVAKCNENGIYLMLTPIAWWGSPNAQPDSFSQNTPKEAMSMWPESWPSQENYLRQFLTHENPYTKNRFVDEPCLTLFEVINEPTYWPYGNVITQNPGETYLDQDTAMKAIEGVNEAWQNFLPSEEWRTGEVFSYFRYNTVRNYINRMVDTMREAGAHQPIAYMRYWEAHSDIYQAIADSRCDAITLGAYPGGLPEEPINDQKNLLEATRNWSMDARFVEKPRLVYEFDPAGTLNLVSMYPAMARQWRHLGVQVACQFQYDARALSHLNWDWPQHYLNLWHTPEKIVSFLIGGEVFRRLPRGATFDTPPDDQIFPPGAVSFAKNAALLCSEDCYMQARPTDWRPITLPENPKHILTVGSCPYLEYDGTGVVEFVAEDDTARLRIYPDVERLVHALRGTVEKPLTRLHEREHVFRMLLPGWREAKMERFENGEWTSVPSSGGEFTVKPGIYRLAR